MFVSSEPKKQFKYYTFDPNTPNNSFYEAINNLGLREVLFFHRGISPIDTLDFLEKQNLFIDMLIIDGSHLPEDEIKDFYCHQSKLKKGAIVVIDDVLYNNKKWGAWELVNKINLNEDLEQIILKHFVWEKKKKKGKASSGIFIGKVVK